MSSIKQTLKHWIPDPVKPVAKQTYDAMMRLPGVPDAYLHPWRQESIKRIRRFHNIHRGERCFIIGNGPSLKKTDLHLLKKEYTFGMNRLYLAFPDMGFSTTYYTSMNDLVVEQCAKDISALKIPKFLSWRAKKWIIPDDNTHFIYSTYTGPRFSRDVTRRVWESATVTYVALQLAYYMGFSTVILIGVDHNFVTQGAPNTTITSLGDDPNHFSPNYFGKGFRWQLPDLDTSEIGYQMAKNAFASDNRQVLDATVDGKLTIFPKVDYNGLFA